MEEGATSDTSALADLGLFPLSHLAGGRATGHGLDSKGLGGQVWTDISGIGRGFLDSG